jgi:hypothetical protein
MSLVDDGSKLTAEIRMSWRKTKEYKMLTDSEIFESDEIYSSISVLPVSPW